MSGPSVLLTTAFEPARAEKGIGMLDLIMLAIGLGFFVVSLGYGIACDRL